jgi:hypothetical protein
MEADNDMVKDKGDIVVEVEVEVETVMMVCISHLRSSTV